MNNPRSYRYRVVDVFTEQPLEGNALAVFTDASGLDDATMQKIARELNLSETTFVSPATRADCAANVRIFTPTNELVFAGHPTIGTSFVLLDESVVPKNSERFALEEKVGPVSIRVEPGERPLIWLTTPPISYGRTFDRGLCARALGLESGDLLEITPQLLSAGNPTIFIAVKDREVVDRAWLDLQGMALLKDEPQERVCVFVFTPTPGGAYSRMFAPEYGIVEDPATGSSTGPLAAFMLRHGLMSGDSGARFVSEQGVKMGRRSFLHIQLHGRQGADGIEVGGYVSPVAEATLRL
jgi:trans-2,3-dihydro-3-hydroxyanthranilate isomerase